MCLVLVQCLKYLVWVSPYWNLNVSNTWSTKALMPSMSISILEFKWQKSGIFQTVLYVWVSPYWNLNWDWLPARDSVHDVWVSPYWNLNYKFDIRLIKLTYVWVSPYWNLNATRSVAPINLPARMSISILEFKFKSADVLL